MHNENGEVDPVKAAETPVPRGSLGMRKRQPGDDGSPLQVKKMKRPTDYDPAYMHQPLHGGHGVLKPQPVSKKASKTQAGSSSANANGDQQQAIDPNLFTMYPESSTDGPNGVLHDQDHLYSYPSGEQTQPYHDQHQTPAESSYQIPSLEQIANEVLVDMNGNEHVETSPGTIAQRLIDGESGWRGADAVVENGESGWRSADAVDASPLENGDRVKKVEGDGLEHPVPVAGDGEVDEESVTMVNGDVQTETETNGNVGPSTNDVAPTLANIEEADAKPLSNYDELVDDIPTNEEGDAKPTPNHDKHIEDFPTNAITSSGNGNVSELPLYQPPTPPTTLSEPQESTNKPQVNGVKKISPSPTGPATRTSKSPATTPVNKRKRSSTASATGSGAKSAKKAKVLDGTAAAAVTKVEAVHDEEEEKRSLELARMLQQEDMGLRRRGSRS